MELKQGGIYILKDRSGLWSKIIKVKVLELTKTSVQYENIDSGNIYRDELFRFKCDFGIIEELPVKGVNIQDVVQATKDTG